MMQWLMAHVAQMVHNGTKAVVTEASSEGLAERRCGELDSYVAVFSNLTRDLLDYHLTEEHYNMSKGKFFAKMVDPERHRKVVNIEDHNSAYFIERGVRTFLR